MLAHSPLGASGAYRWMKCPGSVGLGYGIDDPESDFAAEGTLAHSVAERCLNENKDAWQFIGLEEGKHAVTAKMANAVQVYVDAARYTHPAIAAARKTANSIDGMWKVELRFHCPSLHEQFYGTSDLVAVEGRVLHVWDYKHGAGIVVEVENNPQLMYYAAGVLTELDAWDLIDEVVLHVAQPRGFHFDGPLREWGITTADLDVWVGDVLLPAMDRAMVSRDTASGPHCRFCPARNHACPQLVSDMEEFSLMLDNLEGRSAAALTADQLSRFLQLKDRAKLVIKEAEASAFARLQQGHDVPGFTLVKARANRAWKDDAEAKLKKKFGGKAYTEPALKSPAQIDELPGGKAMTAQYAAKPDAGLTLAPVGDGRAAVKKPSVKSLFKDETKPA